MFDIHELVHPIIGAPMAGGPTTPALVAAVSRVGGLGFLPGGYLSPHQFHQRICEVKALTDRPFGVNLFVPDGSERGSNSDQLWHQYRKQLQSTATLLGTALPVTPRRHDDHFADKLNVVLQEQPAVISFTFGLPTAHVIEQMRHARIGTIATVTSEDEAREAAGAGVDMLCVQGPEAGGHRATFRAEAEPTDVPLAALVAAIRRETFLPIIAAGGIDSRRRVNEMLASGADAVQIGTLMLGCVEADVKAVHLRAILGVKAPPTVVTRSFTGRPARALANNFTREHSASAPALYPEVHYLTAPLRGAAAKAGEDAYLNLWAGARADSVRRTSAAALVAELTPRAPDDDLTSETLAIVGLGPRGLAVLERSIAVARDNPMRRFVVDCFDDTEPGAGRVWTTTQPSTLLMNTVSSQVTMFPDETVATMASASDGPSLFDWLQSPDSDGWLNWDESLAIERRELGPNDYPTRRMYGHYLVWVLSKLVASAPSNIQIFIHRDTVARIDQDGTTGWVVHSKEPPLSVRKAVLAVGHTPATPSDEERCLHEQATEHGLGYIGTGDADWEAARAIRSDDTVLIKGLGLVFFDYLSILTEGRGGTFKADGNELRYTPSGREPHIVAGCRRGVPHHARGINQKGVAARHQPRFLTPTRIAALLDESRVRGGLDFMTDVWPIIKREVEFVYLSTLAQQRGLPQLDKSAECLVRALEHSDEDRVVALAELGFSKDDFLEWSQLTDPCEDAPVTSTGDFEGWLKEYLRRDIASARAGNVRDPLKAALDSLRDLRNEIRQVMEHDTVTPDSYRTGVVDFYNPLSAFLSIGPPMERISQLLALVRAGVVSVVGPRTEVGLSPSGRWFMRSPLVSGSQVEGGWLIDARLPAFSADTTGSGLLTGLLERGYARAHAVCEYRSGAIQVTERPYRVVSSDGRPHSDLYCFGIPTEGLTWATAAGIRPCAGSVIVADADHIAEDALAQSA
ncbi:MAG: nitronate monooxygenase [Bifidobacteriaceae bacterium]|jgi:NAD(P)H-dependent flavin oxidoreductase YrpB (nitropropane dioxygenase family)|nr:nitronate monooxygenase [Bifidobacteriaceae bacterium]